MSSAASSATAWAGSPTIWSRAPRLLRRTAAKNLRVLLIAAAVAAAAAGGYVVYRRMNQRQQLLRKVGEVERASSSHCRDAISGQLTEQHLAKGNAFRVGAETSSGENLSWISS